MTFVTHLGTDGTHPLTLDQLARMTTVPVLVGELPVGDREGTQLRVEVLFVLYVWCVCVGVCVGVCDEHQLLHYSKTLSAAVTIHFFVLRAKSLSFTSVRLGRH